MMQIKLFTIPILDSVVFEQELNAFLSSHKIIEVEKHLVTMPANAYWCVCVSYLLPTLGEQTPKSKVDYRKELDEVTFAKFAIMRKARKEIADKEAVSVFVIFTNAQLAQMAQLPELSIGALTSIKGIGKMKAEKYGVQFLECYKQLSDEASRVSNAKDSRVE
ncbi:MAG: HRDC domain-containing protein [Bernardetiaceae bacterium]|nr:HRDC domain-containing protein [Bernardetiaceae bacterium]